MFGLRVCSAAVVSTILPIVFKQVCLHFIHTAAFEISVAIGYNIVRSWTSVFLSPEARLPAVLGMLMEGN